MTSQRLSTMHGIDAATISLVPLTRLNLSDGQHRALQATMNNGAQSQRQDAMGQRNTQTQQPAG